MRYVISGASGLIGSQLCKYLEGRGHSVLRLVRRAAKAADESTWEPQRGRMDPAPLAGADVVINFSGENITAERWTPEFKHVLLDSRVSPTRTLASALAELKRERPAECPALFISTSAIGFYGYEAGDAELPETAPLGKGFLAEVCRQWEAATEDAEEAGVRSVHLRLGIVLDAAGGPLAKMMEPINKGLGGRLGSGKQLISWIANEEIGPVVEHLQAHGELGRAVNAVAPNAVNNSRFTELLCKQLGKRALLPVPPFVLRTMLGEMADELLLGGQHVVPSKLTGSGYRFIWPELQPLLAHLLTSPPG